MRIVDLTSLHADGGWRPFSFLRIATDEGLTGWSEYAVAPWAPALPEVIRDLGSLVIGRDPRAFAELRTTLQAVTRFAPDGLNQQAIAAIENACVDLASKAAGIPVHALFGGPFRTDIDLYWSHCGSFRARDAGFFTDTLGLPPLTCFGDFERLAQEVLARGYKVAKINPIVFTQAGPRLLNPGFGPGLDHARRLDQATLFAIEVQVAQFLSAFEGQAELMLDLNFGFSTSGFRQIARHLERYRLKWIELDIRDPAGLASVRAQATSPIASLESVYGRRGMLPFLEGNSVDVAVIDILWNGITEAVQMAGLAELRDVNVAPHNFYGPLADLMALQFSASVPNLEIMEIEGDDVPWKYDLLTVRPDIHRGVATIPTTLGWGADINEEAVAAHPWRGR